MQNDEPLAYFITWTVYGTFLQGDERGWRKRRKGNQLPQPKLAQWHRERLKYSIELLDDAHQSAVESEIERLAEFRGWHVWAKNARTNHVHVVVTASGFAGRKVRDQLKANCTRVLRERWPQFVDRPVWTTGGDWQCVNTEDELEQVIIYVTEAQDRMQFDDRKKTTGRKRVAADSVGRRCGIAFVLIAVYAIREITSRPPIDLRKPAPLNKS